jgi:ABC-type transport system involved in cytochrome c biogenesis permease component
MNANVEARPERGRLTAGETIADSRAMTARQLRKILRRPTYIVYLFVQPVILVLLFRYVFGGAINTGRIGYVDFLMPGIIVMTAVFGALTTGLGLTEDLKAGVVDRFRSLPIARSAVLLGRTAADLVMNTLALILMLLIGVAVGFRPDQPFYEVALAFALVLAFAYVFSWISAYVGLSVGDPETAQSAGFIWVFPLVPPPPPSSPPPRCPQSAHLRRPQPRHPDRQRRPRPHHRPPVRARANPRNPRLARRAAPRLRPPGRPRLKASPTGPSSAAPTRTHVGPARGSSNTQAMSAADDQPPPARAAWPDGSTADHR